MRNKAHTHINKSTCTECHNPHGGENRFVLTPRGLNSKFHLDSLKGLAPVLENIQALKVENLASM